MFTGIIREVGTIVSFQRQGETAVLEVNAPQTCAQAAAGDSLCVNGVCLTVVSRTPQSFRADLSNETLSRTTFSTARAGMLVNIEPALRAQDPLGGHLVAGHVDGVGIIDSMESRGEFTDLVVQFPATLAPYLAEKGSVSLEGISLTVAWVDEERLGAALIPYTLQNTNLRSKQPRDSVNLEVDLLARYVERLLKYNKEERSGLTAEKLKDYGF